MKITALILVALLAYTCVADSSKF